MNRENIKKYEEMTSFNSNNRFAGKLWGNACSDYLAGRCCFVNGLLTQGLVLFQQAIEKLMKSAILYSNPEFNFDTKKYKRHRIEDLIEPLQRVAKIELSDEHVNFCEKLTEAYTRFRYPEFPGKQNKIHNSFSTQSSEIDKVDNLFFFIDERIDSNEYLKYFTSMYVSICEPVSRDHVNYANHYYITVRNKYVEENMADLKGKYKRANFEVYGR